MNYALGAEAALEDLGVKLAEVIARVYSQSQKGRRYTVRKDDGQYSCSCPDFKYRHAGRGTHCKHIKTRIGQEKTAATFYRGMGEGFIPQVLKEGLPQGAYMSTDPAVAQHYAGTGADNTLAGDHLISEQFGAPAPHYTKQLEALGFDERTGRFIMPNSAKPSGAVLKITLPDDSELTRPGPVSRLSEHVAQSRIAPEHIEVLGTGFAPSGHTSPQVATRLTPRMLRLAKAAKKRGVDVAALYEDVSAGRVSPDVRYPQPWETKDNAEYLRQARSFRRELEKQLSAAASRNDVPPVYVEPPAPQVAAPTATAAPATTLTTPTPPAVPPGFNWKHPAVLGAGALGLAGLGYGAYRMFDRKRKERQAADDAASAA